MGLGCALTSYKPRFVYENGNNCTKDAERTVWMPPKNGNFATLISADEQ